VNDVWADGAKVAQPSTAMSGQAGVPTNPMAGLLQAFSKQSAQYPTAEVGANYRESARNIPSPPSKWQSTERKESIRPPIQPPLGGWASARPGDGHHYPASSVDAKFSFLKTNAAPRSPGQPQDRQLDLKVMAEEGRRDLESLATQGMTKNDLINLDRSMFMFDNSQSPEPSVPVAASLHNPSDNVFVTSLANAVNSNGASPERLVDQMSSLNIASQALQSVERVPLTSAAAFADADWAKELANNNNLPPGTGSNVFGNLFGASFGNQ